MTELSLAQDGLVANTWIVTDETGKVYGRYPQLIDAMRAKALVSETQRSKVDDPYMNFQGPISVLDIHDPRQSPAPTVSPRSSVDLGDLVDDGDEAIDGVPDGSSGTGYCPCCGSEDSCSCPPGACDSCSCGTPEPDVAIGNQTPWTRSYAWIGIPAAHTKRVCAGQRPSRRTVPRHRHPLAP